MSISSLVSGRIARLGLVLMLLAAVIPAVLVGRQAGAQDTAGTPGATPGAGTVAGLATAGVVPADALLFAAVTLDPTSDQITQSEALLDRAGLGDLLDSALDDATTDVTGDAGDVSAILDGEAAVVVTDRVVETFADLAAGSAGAMPPIIEEVTGAAPDDDATAATVEVDEDSSDVLDNLATPEPDLGDDTAAPADPAAPGGFAAVLRPGDPDAAAAAIETLLTNESRSGDIALDETEISGVTVTSLPPDDTGTGSVAVARIGDLFVVAPSVEDIEPFIAVSVGDADALDADPAFVRARTELPDDFLAFGFVNGPGIRTAIEPILEEAAAEMVASGFTIQDDQLAQLDAYNAFIVRADTPGFRFETATFAAGGAELPPLPAGGEVTLDGTVPGDTLLFVEGFELGETLAPALNSTALTLAQLAMQNPETSFVVPEGASEEEQIAAVYDFLGRVISFNPKTDLIDQMTGEWAFALTVRSLTDPSGIGAVFTSGVNDATLVTDATTKLAAYVNILAIGLAISAPDPAHVFATTNAGTVTEEVEGSLTQVVEIPIPPSDPSLESDTPVDQTEAGAEVPTVRLQWGIVDGRFVFGVNDGFGDLVEGADGGVLADNPRYQAIMAELPEPANGVFYLDLGQLITLLEPIIFGEGGMMDMDDHDAMPLPDDDDGLATPMPSSVEPPDLSGIEALAAVSYVRDDVRGVSALLQIAQ